MDPEVGPCPQFEEAEGRACIRRGRCSDGIKKQEDRRLVGASHHVGGAASRRRRSGLRRLFARRDRYARGSRVGRMRRAFALAASAAAAAAIGAVGAPAASAPSFASEQLVGTLADDNWEPTTAADPTSSYVYQAVTAIGAH